MDKFLLDKRKRMTTHSCGDIICVKENDKEEAKKEDICKLKVI